MYEIGDRVIYQGADKDAYKRVGTLKSIEEKDGKPQLTVEFDGGETFTAPVDDWSREFTNACRNAKFKDGDRVYVSPGKLRGVGGFGVIKGDVGAYDRYWVKFDDEVRAIQLPESVLKSADSWSNASTSTNSVVRNAMVAKALNACGTARNAGGYFVYWAPWSKKADIVAEEIIKQNPRIKTKGANLMIFGSIEEAKKVYDLFRAKGVRSNDLNYDRVP